MHIISGKYKGRKIESLPGKEVRPTTGKAKEGIFNILTHGKFYGEASPILNARVIDIFCGTGALGLETLSRGARHVTFVDQNAKSLEITRKNAEHMGESANCTFLRADSTKVPPANVSCSLAFIDPPYGYKLAIPALKNLGSGGWLENGAIVVIEQGKTEDMEIPENYKQVDMRIYNNTKILILEFTGQGIYRD